MYRPTEDSIMFTNKGQYNAPSREAIYYHLGSYSCRWLAVGSRPAGGQ